MSEQTYCHCYPVFGCKPATAQVEGPNGEWTAVCERCMETAWMAGLRVRKLTGNSPQPPKDQLCP